MHRLYTDQILQAGGEVALTADRAHYAARVLRLNPGDALVLFNGHGGEYHARVISVGRGAVVCSVGEHDPENRRSALDIRLVQGLSRRERMEFTLQKATELGVAEIQPVICQRSVHRLTKERAAGRMDHWRGVLISSCEQCGLNLPPTLHAPLPLEAFLRNDHGEGTRLVLSPDASNNLAGQAPPGGPVTLLCGPEGGFTGEELELARAASYRSVSLGPRVLRTETAAIVAMACLQLCRGDLAG